MELPDWEQIESIRGLLDESARWESAYKKLFATNENHIDAIELGDRVMSMFLRRLEQQAGEISRLRTLLHERWNPTCIDDDPGWSEE